MVEQHFGGDRGGLARAVAFRQASLDERFRRYLATNHESHVALQPSETLLLGVFIGAPHPEQIDGLEAPVG